MLPKVPIIRLSDSLDLPLPFYSDGIGTSMILLAAVPYTLKINPDEIARVPTGFACSLPAGMEAQIRSLKNAVDKGLLVADAPHTIDASERSEIVVNLLNQSGRSLTIRRGEPIALLVFAPVLRIEWDEIIPEKKNFDTSKEVAPSAKINLENEEDTGQTLLPEEPKETLLSQIEIEHLQEQADKDVKEIEGIEMEPLTSHKEEDIIDTNAAQKIGLEHSDTERLDIAPPNVPSIKKDV